MRLVRRAAMTVVTLLMLASICVSLLPRFDYARQDREHVNETASAAHWLGTDDLGRDRFARLLHGTRVSLMLAPAAAVIAVLLALLIGGGSGFAGGFCYRAAKALIDLFLSMPWLFLLLTVRALLPLNTSPLASAAITFLMLGLLGWAAPARILQARSSRLRHSQYILLAEASGVRRARLLCRHVVPNLVPVAWAQFWISLPVFILAEANLSLLGLGVGEPLPSLGGLLRDMEGAVVMGGDVFRFSALILLVVIVSSLQLAVSQVEVS